MCCIRSISAALSVLVAMTQAGISFGQETMMILQSQAPSIPSKTNSDKLAKLQLEEDEFMRHYVSLPPQEQVEIWRHASSRLKYLRSTVDWRMQTEMESVLIIAGVNSVPYLIEVLRASDKIRQIRTLNVLSDMDRFVPDEEITLEVARGGVHAKALGRGGRVSPFVPVDGRRIGKEGFEAIQWAAQQKDNELLQLLAKRSTRALRNELENLPPPEQVQRWREAVIKCQTVIKEAQYPEASVTYRLLETIFMEKMPDSIPALVALLEQDKDPFVRSELISIFERADLCSVRLRKIEAGRVAIDAVLSALNQGPLDPSYTQQIRKTTLEHIPAQFLRDQVYIGRSSVWALYAQALQSFYGDSLIPDYNPKWIRDPGPELRAFLTYLTERDPYFLRWGYINCSARPEDEVLNPGFPMRIQRLDEQWRHFEAEERNGAATLN